MNLRNVRAWMTDDEPRDYIPGGGATAWVGLAFAGLALLGIGVALVWWVR